MSLALTYDIKRDNKIYTIKYLREVEYINKTEK